MTQQRIILVAGGTGGHVFPACALGEELLSRSYRVSILTDARGAQYGWNDKFELYQIPSMQLRGSPLQALRGIVSLITGFLRSRQLLRQLQPKAVVGFGGYVTLTPLLAARFQSIPTMIHQSDALLGKANRILAPYVDRIATSFSSTQRLGNSLKSKEVITGLPLRKGIKQASFKEPADKLHILVTGGSQGAKFFGDIIPQAIKLLSPKQQKHLVITHQCRSEYIDEICSKYEETRCTFELKPFFQDMQERYSMAHLVICRSGASSTLEAATVGRPAFFVPYPYAADDHQTANAEIAAASGGAWCIQQKDLSPLLLAQKLSEFLTQRKTLTQAAKAIRQIVVTHGEKKLADALEVLILPNSQSKEIAA